MLELEYVVGDMVSYPPGATFGPRRMGDLEVVWIEQGQCVYEVAGRRLPAPPGSVVLCRPGAWDGFEWDPEGMTRHGFFHTALGRLPGDWPPLEAWPIIQAPPEGNIVHPLLAYVLGWCQAEHGRPRCPPPPMIRRAVETLLGALVVGPARMGAEISEDYPAPVSAALASIRCRLEAAPAEPITLAVLAKDASVSREHLCRLFTASFGCGPIEVTRRLRLQRAGTLMARSNLSLKEIAYRIGFSSPYHFSRAFRAVYGMAPSHMRGPLRRGERVLPHPLARRAGGRGGGGEGSEGG